MAANAECVETIDETFKELKLIELELPPSRWEPNVITLPFE